jgi:hypothetical protein
MTENDRITLAINFKYVLRQVWSHFSTGDDFITILNFPRPEPPRAYYSPLLLLSYWCRCWKRDSAIHTNWSNYIISQKPFLDWAFFNGQKVRYGPSYSSLFLC